MGGRADIEGEIMGNRVRFVLIGAGLAASGLLLQGSIAETSVASSATGSDTGGGASTMRWDIQFSPPSYTDLGDPGPSAADVIVFHDQLLQDGRNVGDEVGSCVVVESSGLANCTGVVQLKDRGTITFAFANTPDPSKTLAITGGSGQFRTVQGDGHVQESGNGTGTLVLRLVR